MANGEHVPPSIEGHSDPHSWLYACCTAICIQQEPNIRNLCECCILLLSGTNERSLQVCVCARHSATSVYLCSMFVRSSEFDICSGGYPYFGSNLQPANSLPVRTSIGSSSPGGSINIRIITWSMFWLKSTKHVIVFFFCQIWAKTYKMFR